MPVGKLTIELHIPHAQSLKDRRQVVRSIKQSLRNGFNASIAELNEGGTVWNQASLGAAVISSSTEAVQKTLSALDDAAHRLASGLGAEIVDSWAEILPD